MRTDFRLLGLDTFEVISIGSEHPEALSWSLMDHQGPLIDLFAFDGQTDVIVMLPRDLLERLYQRFAALNPKGTIIVSGEAYADHIPDGMSTDEALRLEEDGKLYQDIAIGSTRLAEIVPELTQPDVIARLAADLGLDPVLMSHAARERAISFAGCDRHPRWSPEWLAYVEECRANPDGHTCG